MLIHEGLCPSLTHPLLYQSFSHPAFHPLTLITSPSPESKIFTCLGFLTCISKPKPLSFPIIFPCLSHHLSLLSPPLTPHLFALTLSAISASQTFSPAFASLLYPANSPSPSLCITSPILINSEIPSRTCCPHSSLPSSLLIFLCHSLSFLFQLGYPCIYYESHISLPLYTLFLSPITEHPRPTLLLISS